MSLFVNYLNARYEKEVANIVWMNYVADSMFYSTQQKSLTERYSDIMKKPFKSDNRSGDEIVQDVMERGGLRFEDG